MKNLIITIGLISILIMCINFQFDITRIRYLNQRLEWAASDIGTYLNTAETVKDKEIEEILERYFSEPMYCETNGIRNGVSVEIYSNPLDLYTDIFDGFIRLSYKQKYTRINV